MCLKEEVQLSIFGATDVFVDAQTYNGPLQPLGLQAVVNASHVQSYVGSR